MLQLCVLARRRLGLRLGSVLMAPLRRRMAPDLRMVVSGGAALNQEVAWKLEGLGWLVATGYGLTETSPMLTINLPDSLRFETAGQIVPGVELRIDTSAAPDGTHVGAAGRGAGVRPRSLQGLLELAGEDGRGVHRGRLVSHRRPGLAGELRLPASRRPAIDDDRHRRRRERAAGHHRGGLSEAPGNRGDRRAGAPRQDRRPDRAEGRRPGKR